MTTLPWADASMLGAVDAGPPAVPPTMWSVLSPYLAVLFTAFVVAAIATPVMRALALRHGIVDVPDLKRKNHARAVAYLGGVGIFLGWFAGVGLALFLPAHNIDGTDPAYAAGMGRVAFPLSIIAGATAVVVTGIFDDVYGIRARVKVGGQLFAAAAIASQDVGVKLIFNAFNVIGLGDTIASLNTVVVPGFGPIGDTLVYTLGTAAIAVFVLGACNSVNLIDGLDGLAAGVVAIAMAGFLLIALIIATRHVDPQTMAVMFRWDPVRIVMCLAVIGALLGFLLYNWNPASIFMGDAGSLLLGYFAATTILLFSDTAGYALKLVTAALIVFAVPITDTSLAIIRRKIRGYPIFAPDNQHIHHLLRRAGLSVKQAVGVMYAAGVVFAALGVGMIALEWSWRYILVVFVVMYGSIMVAAFRYGAYQLELERRAAREAAAHAGADAGNAAPLAAAGR